MKLIVDFEEMGAIAEFNGMQCYKAEQGIINKAADFMVPHLENEDYSINYKLTVLDWENRMVVFFFHKD